MPSLSRKTIDTRREREDGRIDLCHYQKSIRIYGICSSDGLELWAAVVKTER